MARRFETLGDLAAELAGKTVYELPDDYFATFARHVEDVTPADALRVARAHLDPARMTVVVVGDRGAVLPQLEEAHLGGAKVVDLDGKELPASPSPPASTPAPAPARK